MKQESPPQGAYCPHPLPLSLPLGSLLVHFWLTSRLTSGSLLGSLLVHFRVHFRFTSRWDGGGQHGGGGLPLLVPSLSTRCHVGGTGYPTSSKAVHQMSCQGGYPLLSTRCHAGRGLPPVQSYVHWGGGESTPCLV